MHAEENREKNTDQLWNRQLDLQVEMVRESDVAFLSRLRPFRRAKMILEMGSGNGEYLCSLAEAFPKKNFMGVERNATLVRRALAKGKTLSLNNTRFLAYDFFSLVNLPTRYDLIVARLVIQHLPDLEAFARAASELLNPGGTLLLVEFEDERLAFNPPVPKAKSLFKAIRRKQPNKRSPLDVLRAFRRRAKAFGLSQVRDESRAYRFGTGRKRLAHRFISHTAELVRAVYHLDPKEAELEAELKVWQATKGSEMQIGYRFAAFKKRRFRWLAFFF